MTLNTPCANKANLCAMRKCEKLLVRSTAPPHLVSYTIHSGISNVHNILHGCYKTIVCTNCLFGTCYALTWRAQYSCTLATPEPNAFSNNKAPWRLSSFLIDLLLGFGDGTTNTPSATTHYPSFVDLNHWQLFPEPSHYQSTVDSWHAIMANLNLMPGRRWYIANAWWRGAVE